MSAVCPDNSLLQQFVLGQASGEETESLEAHVATCPGCARRLSTLPASDPLVAALQEASRMGPAPDAAFIEAVIPRLKRLGRPDETLPQPTENYVAAASDGPATWPEYDFLAPGGRPDELGMLGPYRLLRLLGAGGMGMVFLAEDPRLRRRIALKVIRPELMARAELREHFLAEARAAAAVEHDNIVAVYEVNEESGVPYLTMPLLVGRTLEERLRAKEGPPAVGEILHVGRQIADGLAAAHARGLVHRDIKPGNVWLETGNERKVGQGVQASAPASRPPSPLPRVKILDFGLAQAASAETADGHAGRAIAGTPGYMAPEQAEGSAPDARADLFSLGCLLYRMAAGRPPFQGADTMATLKATATESPSPLARVNRAVPLALADLVGQLLAKRPDDRPASAEAVAAALRRMEEARRPKPSRRRLFLGAACVLAAAMTVGLAVPFQPAAASQEPGTVTFAFDAPDQRLALSRGEEAERVIDVHDGPSLTLPAGDYALRPLGEVGRRRLFPDRVQVRAGQERAVHLQLVGEVRRHHAHALPVRGVAAAGRKDGLLIVSVSEDRTLAAWDPARPDKPKVVWHRDSPLRCVAVAAGGRLAATGAGDVGPRAVQVVRLWDLDKLEPGPTELTCRSQVNAVAFSPDGKRLFSAENDGGLAGWDARAGAVDWEEPRTHEGLGAFALAVSPDGNRLLSGGGDGRAVVRDAATGRVVRTLEGHAKAVRAVAFLPDGTAVSAGLDGAIRVWDMKTAEARVWTAPDPIHALAVSPDGKRLLTGDAGGAVRLWDAAGGKEVLAFTGHAGAVTAVAWAPEGRRAVSGGLDGTVRLWDLPD